jgi:SSS family transporter
MLSHSWIFLVVLCLYLLLIMSIGVAGLRKSGTEEDFLTAGRSIGPWVGGAVLAATQISAGTLVGSVGRHYAVGVDWVWVWPGVWFGWFLAAVFVGPKLRQFGAMTIPDYLAARFESSLIRGVSAIFIVSAYMVLLVAQYQACGIIFQAIFGVRPLYAMLLLAASTLIYTLLGGVRSSSYIDFLQIFVILCGLFLAVPFMLHQIGGLRATGVLLHGLDPRLTGHYYTFAQKFGVSLSLGLGMAAAPYEMVRFYSMKDKATVRNAIGVCYVLQVLIGGAVLMLGLCIRAIFPQLASADQASSMMALNILSPLTGSLFLVALISAIMSNSNAVLLVTSAGISHDIYGKLINRQATEKTKLLVNRLSILFLSLLPIWFALQNFTDVQAIVIVAIRLVASFFFVPVVIGLNARFGSAPAAIAAMIGGCIGSVAWGALTGTHNYNIDPALAGIVSSLVIYLIVGSFTGRVSPSTLALFFREERRV